MERLITLWIQDLELIKAKSLFDSIKENNIFDPKLTENWMQADISFVYIDSMAKLMRYKVNKIPITG